MPDSDCLFCRMVSGEISPDIVGENNGAIAFRDVNPVAPVHDLVIPREHYTDVAEITDKDPDTHSPTLRRHHQLLWSKPLPNGAPLELDVTTPYVYLHHRSDELGEFFLSSDAVIPRLVNRVTAASALSSVSPATNRLAKLFATLLLRTNLKICGCSERYRSALRNINSVVVVQPRSTNADSAPARAGRDQRFS